MLHNCVRSLAVNESDVTDIVLDHFASLCFHVLSFTRLHRAQWPNIAKTDKDNPTGRVLVALQKVFLKQSEMSSLVSEVGRIRTLGRELKFYFVRSFWLRPWRGEKKCRFAYTSSFLCLQIAKALHAIRCHMLTTGSVLHKGHALHAVQIFFESNPYLFLHPYSIKILTKICCESLETDSVELTKAAIGIEFSLALE